MNQQKIEMIEISNLHLDISNPRLPISFQNTNPNEEDIINWMLQDASVIELMLAIGQNGFFVGEALLVVKTIDSKGFIVVEGNRRLTSLKLLDTPNIAKVHTKKIQKVLEETEHRPKEIPCIVFDSKDDIVEYLGYRHVTGIKSWGMLEKARYLNSLIPTLKTKNLQEQSKELAKKIGSRSDYVKRVLVAYKIYEEVQDNGFFKIPKLDDTTIHFNYFADSLRHENIKSFLNVKIEDNEPLKELSIESLENLTKLFFEKNSQNRSRVLGNSDNLTKLNRILADKEVTLKLINDGESLDDCYSLIEVDSDTFHNELNNSLKNLKNANSYIHRIKIHNSSDIDTLKEIVELCKTIRNSIQSKSDDWSL